MTKKKIELHELDGVFLSIQFLLSEEDTVFTEYGKGLVQGLIDPSAKRTCPVVIRADYEKLEKEKLKLEEKVAELEKATSALIKKGVIDFDELNTIKARYNLLLKKSKKKPSKISEWLNHFFG